MIDDRQKPISTLGYFREPTNFLWPSVRLVLWIGAFISVISSVNAAIELIPIRVASRSGATLTYYLQSSDMAVLVGGVIVYLGHAIACTFCARFRRGRLITIRTAVLVILFNVIQFTFEITRDDFLHGGSVGERANIKSLWMMQITIGIFRGCVVPSLIIATLTRPKVRQLLYDR